jgi:hypothetical protein
MTPTTASVAGKSADRAAAPRERDLTKPYVAIVRYAGQRHRATRTVQKLHGHAAVRTTTI